MAATLAVAAALAGAVVLVLAAVRLVGVFSEESAIAPATTLPAVTTTLPATTSAPPAAASAAAVTLTDDSGAVSITVPAAWSDTSGSPWFVEGAEVGPAITAAVDIEDWHSAWDTPGAFIGVATSGFRPDLGDFSGVCVRGPQQDRTTGSLVGTIQSWSSCGGAGSDFLVFRGEPEGGGFVVLVQLVSTDGSGPAELDRMLATFSYQG